DPKSNNPEDKKAVKYNMDLSYRRANAIFGYVLDDNNLQFGHQKELVSLMKVSGRSFLEVMKVNNRGVANANDFCKQNDCKKAQRVIIRFNVDPKK
ncbi:MAG: microtubule-binding protein, partial [Proteobacteria bacterium]